MLEVDGATVVAQELKRPLLELRQLAFGFDGNGKHDEKIRIKMVSVADKAIRQVNDLSKIEKLSSGVFSMEPVAVRALCDDVINEMSELFGEKKGKMTVKYSNRSRLVIANSELLQSVVYNFLLNAINYNDGELRTELKVKEAHGKVEINVRDFGPMLPFDVWKEIKANLTKPYDIAMRPGSSAVGLYIASKFSKYMHAEIGAVRHRDGASFFVKIPVSRQMNLWGM
jgi:signal transduction histidine kinase